MTERKVHAQLSLAQRQYILLSKFSGLLIHRAKLKQFFFVWNLVHMTGWSLHSVIEPWTSTTVSYFHCLVPFISKNQTDSKKTTNRVLCVLEICYGKKLVYWFEWRRTIFKKIKKEIIVGAEGGSRISVKVPSEFLKMLWCHLSGRLEWWLIPTEPRFNHQAMFLACGGSEDLS